jgi:hypothetical protein
MRRRRGEHLGPGHVDVGVRRPTARLRSVARDVGRVESLADGGAGDEHGRRLCTVPAGAGELEADVGSASRCAGSPPRTGRGDRWWCPAPRAVRSGSKVRARDGREAGAVGDVLLHTEREDRFHAVPHPGLGLLGLELEVDRALGQDLDQGEAGAVHLQLEGLLDGALGVRPVAVVVERDPLDEDRAVECAMSSATFSGWPANGCRAVG